MPDDDMTVTDAAALLGIAPASLHYLITAGRLPARRVGPIYLLRRDDVTAHALLMRDRQRPGPKPVTPR
jgi:excisionase family DNA binding protein